MRNLSDNLYPATIADLLLGNLCNNPELLSNPQYKLSTKDFSPVPVHKTIFKAIKKLYQSGSTKITYVDIDSLLTNYKKDYKIWTENDGDSLIETACEVCTPESFGSYYETVRKFSLLRELSEYGFPIDSFYNEDDTSVLYDTPIDKILQAYEDVVSKIRTEYQVNYTRSQISITEESAEAVLQEYENRPSFGAFLSSPSLSALSNGWNRGHVLLEGASSGSGKSRRMVADLCSVGSMYIWDDTEQEFVKNENYQSPVGFIHTEMTSTEVMPLFLASVSGVQSNSITRGTLTKEERARVIEASRIMSQSGFTLCDMADFNMQKVESKIREMNVNGIQYLGFDYCQNAPEASREFNQVTGMPTQEHLMLRYQTTRLKEIAEKYMVGIRTACQLNGSEVDAQFAGAECLQGSKSIINKVDAAWNTVPLSIKPKKLFQQVNSMIHERGVGTKITPNRVLYFFKGRYSQYADQKICLFQYFDAGRCRVKDLLATDMWLNEVSIEIPELEYID